MSFDLILVGTDAAGDERQVAALVERTLMGFLELAEAYNSTIAAFASAEVRPAHSGVAV